LASCCIGWCDFLPNADSSCIPPLSTFPVSSIRALFEEVDRLRHELDSLWHPKLAEEMTLYSTFRSAFVASGLTLLDLCKMTMDPYALPPDLQQSQQTSSLADDELDHVSETTAAAVTATALFRIILTKSKSIARFVHQVLRNACQQVTPRPQPSLRTTKPTLTKEQVHELARSRPVLKLNCLAVERDERLSRLAKLRSRLAELRVAREEEQKELTHRREFLAAKRRQLQAQMSALTQRTAELSRKSEQINMICSEMQRYFGVNEFAIPQFCLLPNDTNDCATQAELDARTMSMDPDVQSHIAYMVGITKGISQERSRLASELLSVFGLKPRTPTTTSVFDVSLPNDLRHLQLQPQDPVACLRTSFAMGHVAQLINYLATLYPDEIPPHLVVFDQTRSFIIRSGPSALASALAVASALPTPGQCSPAITIQVDELAGDAHSTPRFGPVDHSTTSIPPLSLDRANPQYPLSDDDLHELCCGARTHKLIAQFLAQGLDPPQALQNLVCMCHQNDDQDSKLMEDPQASQSAPSASIMPDPTSLLGTPSEPASQQLEEPEYTTSPELIGENSEGFVFRVHHDDDHLFVATPPAITAVLSSAHAAQNSNGQTGDQRGSTSSSLASPSVPRLLSTTGVASEMPSQPTSTQTILFGTPIRDDHLVPSVTHNLDRHPLLQLSSRVPSGQLLFADDSPNSGALETGTPHQRDATCQATPPSFAPQNTSSSKRNPLTVRVRTCGEAQAISLACTDDSDWLDGEKGVFIDVMPTVPHNRKSGPDVSRIGASKAKCVSMLRWASASAPNGQHIITYAHALIPQRLNPHHQAPESQSSSTSSLSPELTRLKRIKSLLTWRARLVGDRLKLDIPQPLNPGGRTTSIPPNLPLPLPPHSRNHTPTGQAQYPTVPSPALTPKSYSPSLVSYSPGSNTNSPGRTGLTQSDSPGSKASATPSSEWSYPVLGFFSTAKFLGQSQITLETLGYGAPNNRYCISALEFTKAQHMHVIRDSIPNPSNIPRTMLPSVSPSPANISQTGHSPNVPSTFLPRPRANSDSARSDSQGISSSFTPTPSGLTSDATLPSLQRWSLGWIDFRTCSSFKDALHLESRLVEYSHSSHTQVLDTLMTTPSGAILSERLQQTAALLAENLNVIKRAAGISPSWRDSLLLENLVDLLAAIRLGPAAILNTNELQQRLRQQQSEIKRATKLAQASPHQRPEPTPAATQVQPMRLSEPSPQAERTPDGVAQILQRSDESPKAQSRPQAEQSTVTGNSSRIDGLQGSLTSNATLPERPLGASWEVLNMSLDPMVGLLDAVALRPSASLPNPGSPMNGAALAATTTDKVETPRSPSDTLPNLDSILFSEAKDVDGTSGGQSSYQNTLEDVYIGPLFDDASQADEVSERTSNISASSGSAAKMNNSNAVESKASEQADHSSNLGRATGLSILRRIQLRRNLSVGEKRSDPDKYRRGDGQGGNTLSLQMRYSHLSIGNRVELDASLATELNQSDTSIEGKAGQPSTQPQNASDMQDLAPLALELAISGVSHLTHPETSEAGNSALSPTAPGHNLATSSAASLGLNRTHSQLPTPLPDSFFNIDQWAEE